MDEHPGYIIISKGKESPRGDLRHAAKGSFKESNVKRDASGQFTSKTAGSSDINMNPAASSVTLTPDQFFKAFGFSPGDENSVITRQYQANPDGTFLETTVVQYRTDAKTPVGGDHDAFRRMMINDKYSSDRKTRTRWVVSNEGNLGRKVEKAPFNNKANKDIVDLDRKNKNVANSLTTQFKRMGQGYKNNLPREVVRQARVIKRETNLQGLYDKYLK